MVPVVAGIALGMGLFLTVVPGRELPTGRVRRWMDEVGFAGIPLSVIALVTVTVATIIGALSASIIPLPAVAPVGFLAGVGIPFAVLASIRDARRRRARSMWPDIIDSIRMSLRAGMSLTDAVSAAHVLVPKEWRTIWSALDADVRHGAEIDGALRRLQHALADPIADRVVESMLIAREFGGTELPSVLAELARSVRRERAIRDEAQSRQSWVRHAATLGIVSPWIVLAMLASRPENRVAFSSFAGSLLIVGAAGATVVAYFTMSALGTLREEKRWLRGVPGD